MTEDVELLSQGTEPAGVPRRLGRGPRSVLTALVVGAVVAGAVGSALHGGSGAPPRPTAIVAVPTYVQAPRLAPRLHQIHLSTTDQSAQVTSRGHIDLNLQLVNDGSFPLHLLNVRMPQPGVRADPGPGGLVSAPAIAELAPDTPTPVTVHLYVRCPQGLSGAAADHLDLTLQDDRGTTRSTTVDLESLPGFWDRVRHSACESGPSSGLVVVAMPTSVRWQEGTT